MVVRMLASNNRIISFSRILSRKNMEVVNPLKFEIDFFHHSWCFIGAGGVIISSNVSIGQYVTFSKNKERKS